jgi:hypothetical protein
MNYFQFDNSREIEIHHILGSWIGYVYENIIFIVGTSWYRENEWFTNAFEFHGRYVAHIYCC